MSGTVSNGTSSDMDILAILMAKWPYLTGLRGGKGRFSIDMNALRATNNRFVMIYIISYPEPKLK
jgi:hypothetical protein